MIKVLHIYPKADPSLAQYVDTVTAAMPSGIECRKADSPRHLKEICQDWQPDIAHIHGPALASLPPRVRIVFSPHGAAVSQTVAPCGSPARSKRPQAALPIRKAYVLIARSPIERQHLATAPHSRIEVIRNPLITKTTTVNEAADLLAAVYQKVIDSDVRQLMDEHTLDMLRTLLKAGITADSRWVAMRQLHQDPDWRQLFIYARDEGVLDTLTRGIHTLRLNPPPIDAATICNYLPAGYLPPDEAQPLSIPDILRSADIDIRSRHLSLSRIVQLHSALFLTDVDDVQLLQSLDPAQRQLLSRLLQLASEESLLDEGFMPAPPINDRGTHLIRTLINTHLSLL